MYCYSLQMKMGFKTKKKTKKHKCVNESRGGMFFSAEYTCSMFTVRCRITDSNWNRSPSYPEYATGLLLVQEPAVSSIPEVQELFRQ
jgi:hypothetical protein